MDRLFVLLAVCIGLIASKRAEQSEDQPANEGCFRHLRDELADIATNLTAQTAVIGNLQSSLKSAPAPSPRDCSDLPAGTSSGVHILHPGLNRPAPALCDLDTDGGGWTVFQLRDDIQPKQDFYLGWQKYKYGFGELDGEFWWGLERLWLLTSQLDRRYELRIDMEELNGPKVYAVYQGFRIDSEADNYRLTAVNYTGDAGDALASNNGQPFSTKENDNDQLPGSSCASYWNAGWWFSRCGAAHLNGVYAESNLTTIAWRKQDGTWLHPKKTTMKIRPTKKL